ncbi:DUF5592 family protein [Listeria booriae]|uniref:Uncharacterized protein n=1 Tax=Listeria booriae TaxID=1552123 RepID=A0A7X1BW47_9LIST|nr:DUF5592 family protein [Listeria booriae]MBC1228811.1 hypothetical protein [Listeria booriae]MBC1333457.1 hypothetical protein [Listeria booriae]MBC2373623.1 hypothetical protein [Listeria booriae]MBC2388762.1 hypothetical protein [Listeria booriae]
MSHLRIPERTSSKVKLFWEIYLQDVIIAIAYGVLLNVLSDYVYPPLELSYWIIMSIGFIFIVLPSRTNKEMKVYQAFFLALLKERDKGIPFDYETEETSREITM